MSLFNFFFDLWWEQRESNEYLWKEEELERKTALILG